MFIKDFLHFHWSQHQCSRRLLWIAPCFLFCFTVISIYHIFQFIPFLDHVIMWTASSENISVYCFWFFFWYFLWLFTIYSISLVIRVDGVENTDFFVHLKFVRESEKKDRKKCFTRLFVVWISTWWKRV